MHAILILWIGLCACLTCTGWVLSLFHQLNAAGYLAVLIPAAIGAALWLKNNPPNFKLGKFLRRFKRPVSAVFLLMTLLILAGGVLHAPNNFDALTYRFPRMLQWLSHSQWFWITTPNERLNYSNTGWEWLGTPLFCLTHSDRFFFLISGVGFLLLPGLIFSTLRNLGVTGRTAWWWMWILPLAYGSATQAASVGNDLTGTVFLLAAIYFGLRARKSRRVLDVWLALLATALMTGVKMSNLPLGLPCLLAVFPALPLLRKHLVPSIAIMGLALMASAIPIMALNQHFTGSWNGDPLDSYKMQVKNPVAGIVGNSLLLLEQSLMPPAILHGREVREGFINHLPEPVNRMLHKDFTHYYSGELTELPGEEGAGLGLGITLALLISATLALLGFGKRILPSGNSLVFSIVIWGGWVSALVYMAKMGSEAAPRLMMPYYPLMIAGVLALPVQQVLMCSKMWRAFLTLIPLFILPAILISPSRPVLPMSKLSDALAEKSPGSALYSRMRAVYQTYSHRNDVLAPLRSSIPAEVGELGLLAGSNDTDYSLWRPFGTRRIIYLAADTNGFLQNHGRVEWAVIKERTWRGISKTPLKEWLEAQGGEIIATRSIVEIVSWGPEDWHLVRFKKAVD